MLSLSEMFKITLDAPTIDDIPSAWRQALAAVQKVEPRAILAGGALRDLISGVKHVDLDIFVPACRLEKAMDIESGIVEQKDLELDGDELNEVDIRKYREWCGGLLISVSNYKGFGETVQVVALDADSVSLSDNSFTDVVLDRMDFGACRIAFDGKTVTARPEAMSDIRNGTFTLMMAKNGAALLRSVERFKRWEDRYPKATFELRVDIRNGPHWPIYNGVQSLT